ncbi:MAG: hypothetical protein JXP48_01910 [Acidobacteria bacterium]|nr:hypothetical protein [Acidobacteriota bacterium]
MPGKVRPGGRANPGFDAGTETCGGLVAAGVLVRWMVTRSGLRNGAFSAALPLSTEALIPEIRDDTR